MPVKTTKSLVKGLRIAPRKVSLVASLIRGRSVADALVILQHTPKRAALPLAKAIESAKANATANHGMLDKDLLIDSISVTAGPRLKRYRPAAHGRALPFQRKTTHVVVVVSGEEKPKKAPAKTESKVTTKKESE